MKKEYMDAEMQIIEFQLESIMNTSSEQDIEGDGDFGNDTWP